MVASTSFPPGAEMMTFFAPALRCADAFSLVVNRARAFENHVDAERCPGKLGGIAVRQHPDPVSVHDHGVAVDMDLPREFSVGRVIARKVSVRFGAAQIVDRDDREIVAALRAYAFVVSAHDVAADAPVSVDRDFDAHCGSPDCVERFGRDSRIRARLIER